MAASQQAMLSASGIVPFSIYRIDLRLQKVWLATASWLHIAGGARGSAGVGYYHASITLT
eukprot:295518-Pyramimonas_sp.AAC.1